MENTEEVWVDIEGYEGKYQVSNLGRVKSLPREFLNKKGVIRKVKGQVLIQILSNGYYFVNLCRKSRPVHRLIGKAFIPNPENKPQINHKDGNKSNNSLDNLEWCTNKENAQHAYAMGLSNPQPKYGKEHGRSKEVHQYDLNGDYIQSFPYMRDAANKLQIAEETISVVCNKEYGSCGGFQWRFYKYSNIGKYERKWKNQFGDYIPKNERRNK